KGSHNPLQAVKSAFAHVRQAPVEGSGFMGGLVGTLGYDAVRYFEKLPAQAPDVLKVPDLYLMLTDKLVLFDHLKRTLQLVVNVEIEHKKDLRATYTKAIETLSQMNAKLLKPLKGVAEIPVLPPPGDVSGNLFGFQSNRTKAEFENVVDLTK